MSDYCPSNQLSYDIATKEALALVLKSCRNSITISWLDIYTDSQVLIGAWNKQGSRARPLFNALKQIFNETLESNFCIQLHFIHLSENPADTPSRRLSFHDICLCPRTWNHVQDLFGGEYGHSSDLMVLPSNVQNDLLRNLLPFFSESPTPSSSGVNIFPQSPINSPVLFRNAYVFPPIPMFGQVLKFLRSFSDLQFTFVVFDIHPRKYWWPIVTSSSIFSTRLCSKGDTRFISTLCSRLQMPLLSLGPVGFWILVVNT